MRTATTKPTDGSTLRFATDLNLHAHVSHSKDTIEDSNSKCDPLPLDGKLLFSVRTATPTIEIRESIRTNRLDLLNNFLTLSLAHLDTAKKSHIRATPFAIKRLEKEEAGSEKQAAAIT